jgi:7-cyano-7-deazaguanine synthase
MQRGALVLFSGGQDSTTCLAWALSRGEHVETIAFDYRQRHRRELEARLRVIDGIRTLFPSWAGRLGADHVLDLGLLGEISETALTREVEFAITASKLPNTFVPGRNLVFLAVAAAVAYRRGIGVLVGGMCETDFSGYPDCRDDAIKAMQVALSLGMDRPLRIETPLMWIDKAQTWQLAKDLGGDALVRLVIEETHTCYLAEKGERHAWGHGCGHCPACALRKRGFEAWTGKS